MGVEIESEGIESFPRHTTLWEGKRDDSLRGRYRAEWVTGPLKGDALMCALQLYARNASRYQRAFSWRCSTHIHMNVLQMRAPQVASLMLTSFAADNYFYAVGAEHRRDNYNCRPVSLLYPTAERLGRAIRYLVDDDIEQGVKEFTSNSRVEEDRYSGMNWWSLSKFGTVEIRHFPGASELPTLVHWINITQSMYQYAERNTFEQIQNDIAEGPDHFGPKVFGPLWAGMLYQRHERDWQEMLEGYSHLMSVYNATGDTSGTLDGILRQHRVI